MRSLGRAIEFEADRQVALLEGGDRVVQETRHWDEDEGRDPVDALQGGGRRLPLLPRARPGPARPRRALAGRGGGIARAAAGERRAGAGRAARWRPVAGPDGPDPLGGRLGPRRPGRGGVRARAPAQLALARTANEVAADVERAGDLDPDGFAKLLVLEASGELSATQAKDVLAELLASGGDPADDRPAIGLRVDGRGRVGRARSTRSSTPTRTTGRASWPATTRCAGFFIGRVMRATANKAERQDGRRASWLRRPSSVERLTSRPDRLRRLAVELLGPIWPRGATDAVGGSWSSGSSCWSARPLVAQLVGTHFENKFSLGQRPLAAGPRHPAVAVSRRGRRQAEVVFKTTGAGRRGAEP